jgi:hypothetical protein
MFNSLGELGIFSLSVVELRTQINEKFALAPVAQLAEAYDSNSYQREFESHPGHKI